MAPEQPNNQPTQADIDAQQNAEINNIESATRRREIALFWIAAFGLAIALTSAVVAALQWGVMRQQTAVMQQQTKLAQTQLADARKAASENDKVTEQQLKIAGSQASSLSTLAGATASVAEAGKSNAASSTRIAQSSERSVRNQQTAIQYEYSAWMWFDGVEFLQSDRSGNMLVSDQHPIPGMPIAMQFVLANTGRTPAADVAVRNVTIDFGDGTTSTSGGVYQQGRSVGAGKDLRIQAGIAHAYNASGFYEIVIRAKLTYKDAFGFSREVAGCYRRVSSGKGMIFVPCAENNTIKEYKSGHHAQ
jgi:Uncharacterised protein family, YAP/Alf4/glomulin